MRKWALGALLLAAVAVAVVLLARDKGEVGETPVSQLSPPPPQVRATLAQLGLVVYQTGPSAFLTALGFAREPGEIYVVGADGRGRRLLTPPVGTGRDLSPSWSPDGRKIAFASWRRGDGDIYVMNADGSGVRRVTSLAGDEISPQWSRDGRRIAFLTNVENVFADVWLTNADGSDAHELYPGAHALFDWGPDERLATIDEAGSLIVVGPEQALVLGDARALNADLAWSPDGSRILFQHGGFSSSTLFVVPADGSAQPRPFPVAGESPVWSPDGSHVALLSSRVCCGAVVVARADGGGVRKLVDYGEVGDWAPDGSFVAYLDAFGVGGREAVSVVPVRGGNAYRVTPYLSETIVRIDWQPR